MKTPSRKNLGDQWVKHIEAEIKIGHHFADDVFKCIFFNENV